ncbi:hypothetical protein Lfu02_76800 [Longispora fulva]|uniref:Actin-binding WH2 domain-containing protein n=1 Tax=Longispora fulva TaxID=619741 RepID=A0A8J7GI36_9ACTN|nr:hypothetical protein [Longispora fulva]MBG6138461.1 hypothetical protein [Longispora fulva]GIG63308.1 hypothetical protein Lfu02_76800 [Longispora fulva]
MAAANGQLVIERILRDREGIWRQIIEQRKLTHLTGQMLASSSIALAVYGAVLGFSNGPLQAVVSLVKLPILFLVTLAICLPTLYLFNLVFGAKLSINQAVSLVMTAITVMSTLALAFTPISLFFLITAPNYSFFKLLNVAILVLSAFVGLKFLTSGMQAFNRHREAEVRQAAMVTLQAPVPAPALVPEAVPVPVPAGAPDADPGVTPAEAPAPQVVMAGPANVAITAPAHPNGTHPGMPMPMPPNMHHGRPMHPGQRPMQPQLPPGERPASMGLLYIWILLFGFVGTQLGWTLRPFFGDPDMKFQLFRGIEGNFYVDIVRTLGDLFS